MNQELELEVNQLHAEFCAGLADPKRLLILYALSEGPRNVGELAIALHISQPATSRHLKVLRERGMVIASRLGPNVEYRLADHRLIEALDILRAILADKLRNQAELAKTLYPDEAF
ncbi:MAG TPA: metalloregulator ArsR/SmtB family transcription factor [Anaerolineales bacterium]|nr:metalloregulator ArsR/SmtB family transcription factor [Anaerolineales bacterium]